MIAVADNKEQRWICYLSGLVNSSVETKNGVRRQNTQFVYCNSLQVAKLKAAETF